MTTNEPSMGAVGSNVLVLVVLLTVVLTTAALFTCVVTHYQHSYHHQARNQETIDSSPSSTELIWNQRYFSKNTSRHKTNSSRIPMLALEANMERERCALRDRQVRLHSVHTDMELDLPTSIHLPDGEEIPYGSSTRLHIRDAEQQSEIYRKCIRPPPNRTIERSEPILPYRSHSTGLLSCNTNSNSHNSGTDWGQNVVRCHSVSSRYNAAVKSSVITPMKSHHQHQQVSAGLAQITMVPCLTDRRSLGSGSNNSEKVHHSSTDSRNSSSANSMTSTTATTSLSSVDVNNRSPAAAVTSTVTINFNH